MVLGHLLRWVMVMQRATHQMSLCWCSRQQLCWSNLLSLNCGSWCASEMFASGSTSDLLILDLPSHMFKLLLTSTVQKLLKPP